MADILNEKQIGELIKAFHAVDDDNDGVIQSSKLGAVLRVMGQNPTIADLQVGKIYLQRLHNCKFTSCGMACLIQVKDIL